MSYILITAGNRNSPTFENVCYAVASKFGSVDVVNIFDTIESEGAARKDSRTVKIREIFGPNVEIRTSRVDENNLQTIIPTRMSKLIEEFGTDKLVVDLTNGQKITASVLYSVAAIARVKKIFSLEMKKDPRTFSPETRLPDLVSDDWDYASVEPLKEINNIARSSQLELVYYRDRIDHACNSIREKDETLAKDFQRFLHNALVHYFAASVNGESAFTERLEDSIAALGKICESISKLAYKSYQQADKNSKDAPDFRTRVNILKAVWEWGHGELSGRRHKKDYALNEAYIQNIIKPTLTLGAILESVIMYRNLVAHPGSHYLLTIDDARFVLSATLLLLEQMGQSEIL